MSIVKPVASALVVLALVLGATPARAETQNCTPITTLPAVIGAPGAYCFTGDLSTPIMFGNAIEIQTDEVVLDLNGFKLGGLAAGPGTFAVGIFAQNRAGITIKNGTIRGFWRGIALQDSGASQDHVVEVIRADQNRFTAIQVDGASVLIRDNQVVATGGSTIAPDSNSYGIRAEGEDPRVLDNNVANTVGVGAGAGTAIQLSSASRGLVVNNRITVADVGIDMSTSTGKFYSNLTSNVTTPFTGGTNAGNNN